MKRIIKGAFEPAFTWEGLQELEDSFGIRSIKTNTNEKCPVWEGIPWQDIFMSGSTSVDYKKQGS